MAAHSPSLCPFCLRQQRPAGSPLFVTYLPLSNDIRRNTDLHSSWLTRLTCAHADVECKQDETETIATTRHYHRYHRHRHVVSDRFSSLAQSEFHEDQLLPFGEYIAACARARHFGEFLHQIRPSALLLRLLLLLALRCVRLRLGLRRRQHRRYPSHGFAGALRTAHLHPEATRWVLLPERLAQLLLWLLLLKLLRRLLRIPLIRLLLLLVWLIRLLLVWLVHLLLALIVLLLLKMLAWALHTRHVTTSDPIDHAAPPLPLKNKEM